ncbi:MAG: AGE family epimerase/isomerase [Candidatus Lokiarchaeota archaeon]|nr:AGE family epimerase/isomerase [Candidatus Lokiarchaeota archaeon]
MSQFRFYPSKKITRINSRFLQKMAGLTVALIVFASIFAASIPRPMNNTILDEGVDVYKPLDLDTSLIPASYLLCPYTTNMSKVYDFFQGNFRTPHSNLLYYRSGNEDGTSFYEDITYSLDNLLFYKTLPKYDEEYDEADVLNAYINLLTTNLKYDSGNVFIHSINGTTGEIVDGDRYLMDNLMPIFLLLENYNPSVKTYIENINTFLGTDLWDVGNYGYYHSNSSTSSKFAIDNLYAVLANLLIYRSYSSLSLGTNAYESANKTIDKLMANMWDNDPDEEGFFIVNDQDWTDLGGSNNNKQLDVNAVGIMALVDYYMTTNKSTYLDNATLLYNRIDANLWVSGEGYLDTAGADYWNTPSNITISSESNALMMQACLKLFEATGNMTYYDKAYELFQCFETNFYDINNNAYDFISPYYGGSTNKNITSNLRVIEANLKASDIYYSFDLEANYDEDLEGVPNFILEEDAMNITSRLSYQAYQGKIYYSNIPINYTIRESNDNGIGWTVINETSGITNDLNKSHELSYEITESMPVKENYSVLIYVYSEKYVLETTELFFDVSSGLVVVGSITGLEEILYQGPTLNVTIAINNTRRNDIILNTTLNSVNIENQSISNILFSTSNLTYISFNLTTNDNAALGDDDLIFQFKKGSVLYFEKLVPITIGDSFKYSPLIYSMKVVNGESLYIAFNLINYLPKDPQSINLSFSGNSIDPFLEEITLTALESKPINVQLNVTGADTEYIVMNLSKNDVVYYTETLEIKIVPLIEIVSWSAPSSTPQWEHSRIILRLVYNGNNPERYSLSLIDQNTDQGVVITKLLTKGENKIEASMVSTLNPYEYGVKSYRFELKDSEGNIITSNFFEVTIELSMTALFLCYILPISIPIALILIYKNKELKNKLLRRSK